MIGYKKIGQTTYVVLKDGTIIPLSEWKEIIQDRLA